MVDDVRVSSHLKEELTWAIDKRLWVISTIMLLKNIILLGPVKSKGLVTRDYTSSFQLPSDRFSDRIIDYGGALLATVRLHYVQNGYYPLMNLQYQYSILGLSDTIQYFGSITDP